MPVFHVLTNLLNTQTIHFGKVLLTLFAHICHLCGKCGITLL